MKKLLKKYVIWTYGIFYCFLLLIGSVMFVFKLQTLAEVLKVISAWTSTFVFIVMFHKIYPKGNLKEYIKSKFSERLKLSTVLLVIMLQFSVFLAGIFFICVTRDEPIKAQLTTSFITLFAAFGNNIIRGPLGEELGWRGFVLNELQKKFNPLKSAIIVGVLWGFWHTPLWLLSGYSGLQLIQYSFCFMVSAISLSIIITIFYNQNYNLIIPIIIHQLFNYFLTLETGDQLYPFTVNTMLYFVSAVILTLIWIKKNGLKTRYTT